MSFLKIRNTGSLKEMTNFKSYTACMGAEVTLKLCILNFPSAIFGSVLIKYFFDYA